MPYFLPKMPLARSGLGWVRAHSQAPPPPPSLPDPSPTPSSSSVGEGSPNLSPRRTVGAQQEPSLSLPSSRRQPRGRGSPGLPLGCKQRRKGRRAWREDPKCPGATQRQGQHPPAPSKATHIPPSGQRPRQAMLWERQKPSQGVLGGRGGRDSLTGERKKESLPVLHFCPSVSFQYPPSTFLCALVKGAAYCVCCSC